MNSVTRGLAAAVAAALVSGCAAVGQPDFSCDGMPGNVTCLDAMTVYELTSDPALDAAVRAEVARRSELGETLIDTKAIVAQIKQTRASTHTGTTTLMAPLNQPMPVLEPARVVRIWVAPWVDAKGDLHMPGYLFSEITPRRWSLGEAEVAGARVLTPMQVERDSATASSAPPAARATSGPSATQASPSKRSTSAPGPAPR
jgi:conjugal transfer pilus assembly protein TraV